MIKHVSTFALILIFINLAGASLTPARVTAGHGSFGFDVIPSMTFNGEYGISKKMGIGASLGLFNSTDQVFVGKHTLYLNDSESSYLESHLTYFFHERDQDVPLNVAFLGGLVFTESRLSVQAGVLLDVPITREFSTRFNLIFGPRAGFELAFRVAPKLEICIDLAVAAGILGARIYF